MKEVISWAESLQNIAVTILFLYDYYIEFSNFSIYQKQLLNF